ncbi:MAG: hypothetical protein LUD15_00135 [Bacteroides sp.]|nr:hypothetical protein [Bacteroides sp.]
MKRSLYKNLVVVATLSVVLAACNESKRSNFTQEELEQEVLNPQVLTAEQQAQLTPAQVLEALKQGNNDFVNDNLTVRNNTERVREASLG